MTVDGATHRWSHPEYTSFNLFQSGIVDPEAVEPGSATFWVPETASLPGGFMVPSVMNNFVNYDPLEPGLLGKQLTYKMLFHTYITSRGEISGKLYYVKRTAIGK